MRSRILAWAVVSLVLAAPVSAQSDCERAKHPVTELGRIQIIGTAIRPEDYPRLVPSGGDEARYVSARVQLRQQGECDWVLVVRDHQYKLIQTLGPADFSGPESSVWTARVYGPHLILDLQQCPAGKAPPVLSVAEYLLMPKETTLNPFYSTQTNVAQWKALYTQDEQHRRLGDFVGFYRASWDREIWSCSGVMIAPDLFLTNWHCGAPRAVHQPGPQPGTFTEVPFPEAGYWDSLILSSVTIDLSWDSDPVSRDFVLVSDDRKKAVVAESKELDYAILKVKPLNYAGRVQPAPLRRDGLGAEAIRIVHHPLSLDKQLSTCEVVSTTAAGWLPGSGNVDFTHKCDTEAGSSGAPVFDAGGRVVGLHHRGFDLDARCQPVLPKLNRAVRMDKILTHLRDNYRPVYDSIPQ